MAHESGVPTADLQPVINHHLRSAADGAVLDQNDRDALIEALVGRWAAAQYLQGGSDGSCQA